jgi:hypothetical protein
MALTTNPALLRCAQYQDGPQQPDTDMKTICQSQLEKIHACLEKSETILVECKAHRRSAFEIKSDLISVAYQSSLPKQRSSIGLVLTDCTITNILAQSYAHRTKKLRNGDIITMVNGWKADANNIAELLRGDDVIDSELTVEICRKSDIIGALGWEQHTVLLKRSCALGLADLQKLEHLFIQIKMTAEKSNSAGVVEEAMTIWSSILEAQDHLPSIILAKFNTLNQQTSSAIKDLREQLSCLDRLVNSANRAAEIHEQRESMLCFQVEALQMEVKCCKEEQSLNEARMRKATATAATCARDLAGKAYENSVLAQKHKTLESALQEAQSQQQSLQHKAQVQLFSYFI